MEKSTCCPVCKREIMEHEPKFLIPNKHADIPISHFVCCAECAEKNNEKQ
jgi:hypothetical protein